MDKYDQFLADKTQSVQKKGIPLTFIPDGMFDFQIKGTEIAINKGRCAVFFGTGLGKTLMELTIAENHIRYSNKRTLILTPLAVAFQFLKEAEKFGISDISYSKEGKLKTKIIIANYERLDKFNPNDFDCLILDESSILKNFNGAIKQQVLTFIKKVKYRYLFTATPSPNDYIELGNSSEALGYLGYTDMLTKFFKNNEDTISPMNIGTEWILKGHAKIAFFQWVSSWAISATKPSDLGCDDGKFILPKLTTNTHKVSNTFIPKGQLFTLEARTLGDMREEQRNTSTERCEKAFELTEGHKTSVYWCNLNAEGDLLAHLDKDAHQISGNMSLDKKEDILLNFFNGDIDRLITKPKMTAFGLNWQRCNHTTFFPTWSYEQYYQAIRRFWRFGQAKEVTVELIVTDGQKRVLNSLNAKALKYDELFSKLNKEINSNYSLESSGFNQKVKLPKFI